MTERTEQAGQAGQSDLGAEQADRTDPAEQPKQQDPDVESAWAAFEARLASALGRMAPETYLVLTTPAEPHEAAYYVQFASGPDQFRAEAVGTQYLPASQPLTTEQEERLDALGWERPAPDDPGRNLRRAWPVPPPYEAIAALAVRTLREVYGVAVPTDLEYAYRSFETKPVDQLDLGIRAWERAAVPERRPRTRRRVDQLAAMVEEAIRRWLGIDNVMRDADGDYPVRIGSALVIVRLHDVNPPQLSIFSPILRDIAASPALFAALNEVNARIRFGRAFWIDRTVVVATEIAAVDVTPNLIALACMELGALADRLDDPLRGRFGGRLMFSQRPTLLN